VKCVRNYAGTSMLHCSISCQCIPKRLWW